MNLRSTFIVYRKELTDVLRDRRTVFSMILFPLILWPLFSVGMMAFMGGRIEKIKEQVSSVAWIAPAGADALKERLSTAPGVSLMTEVADSVVALKLLKEKNLDAVVLVPAEFGDALEAVVVAGDSTAIPPQIALYTDDTREKSGFAARRVSSALEGYRNEIVGQALTDRGMPRSLTAPFIINRRNIASKEEMGRFMAGSLLPYLIILMALMGATYPAIDLTAGEKERGTLETLLVSGVSRLDIVMGKFLTVFTASMVTSVLALGSIAASGAGMMGVSQEFSQQMQFNVTPLGVVLMIVTLIPLGAAFSALLMTLSLFAKSYKEAQSYISPLMILAIVPAMYSMMPDTELSKSSAFIPVVNASMLMKGALMGTFDIGLFAMTMAVNLAFAGLCLYLVLRMFRRESVLFKI